MKAQIVIEDILADIKKVEEDGYICDHSIDLVVTLVQLGFVLCKTKEETENFLNNAIAIVGNYLSLDKCCNRLNTNKKVRQLKTINGTTTDIYYSVDINNPGKEE